MMIMVMVVIKFKIKCSNLEKKKEKKWVQGKGIIDRAEPFCFTTQDTIEGVSGLRIDTVLLRGAIAMQIRLSKCH